MPDQMISNSQIIGAYREKTPGSEKLSMEANEVLPSGIAHDSRYLNLMLFTLIKLMARTNGM